MIDLFCLRIRKSLKILGKFHDLHIPGEPNILLKKETSTDDEYAYRN